MAKIKEKGWAVVVFDEFISSRHDENGDGSAVFRRYTDAEDFLEKSPGIREAQSGRVVPCTITFEV